MPGRKYYQILLQFAQARGLFFFTLEQQNIARRLYEERAKTQN
jgi:hypothetical protein